MPHRTLPRIAIVVVVTMTMLTSCKTTIVGSLESTTSTSSTTTTVPVPNGTIAELLDLLAEVPVGLGQAVVDGDSATSTQKVAHAEAIWNALKPQLESAEPELVEDVGRVVALIHTSAERKRPADGDKALRFVTLIIDARNTR